MNVRMPVNLKNKLCNWEGHLEFNQNNIEVTTMGAFQKKFIQGPSWADLELELIDDIDSLNACYEWMQSMTLITIGPYNGIMPVDIRNSIDSSTVKFHIIDVDPNRGEWQDWFIQDEVYIEGDII